MRKTLLFLFMLSAVYATAQKQASVAFDFSNPTALTPSVTPKEYGGGSNEKLVTNETFTEGPVSINFALATTSFQGASITTQNNNGSIRYFLSVFQGTNMTINAKGDATIDKIVLSVLSPGDLNPVDDTGTFKNFKIWERNETESNVKSVTFHNSGSPSKIYSITVYYTTPSDILKPQTSTISNGDELPAFENLVLTFDRSMTVASTKGITLTRILEDGNEETALTASASGSKVTIRADKKIEKNGTYKITIPARCLRDADGWENAALEYTFTVNVPKNTFGYVYVDPVPGRLETVKSGIKLTFAGKVSDLEADLSPIRMFKDEEETPCRLLYIAKDAEDENSVVLNFINDTEDITENGTYKITIPEGYIYNILKGDAEYERYNPEIVLTYTISDEPEPLPEPDPVEIACTLTPATSDGSATMLTLAFAEGSEVTLAAETGAYFTNTTGDNIGDATITATEGGTFLVDISGLSYGNYTLNIPEGMFTTTVEGDRTAKVKAISKPFSIERIETGDFNYDFYSFNYYNANSEYVKDTFFNNFIIYSWKPIFADPKKTVKLVNYYNIKDVAATGHFEPTTIPEYDYALKLILDNPIVHLEPNKYTFFFEPATFGDTNFGKYITGDHNITKKDCHVNQDFQRTFDVDNDKATFIEGIEADKDTDMRIYNIMGQPVKSMDAPGVYIINGKKYVKK